jgi:hypothetical protein
LPSSDRAPPQAKNGRVLKQALRSKQASRSSEINAAYDGVMINREPFSKRHPNG